MGTVVSDVKYSLRQLRKSPGFTAIIVLTLALGIGANTAIFSIVNTTFLRALPYPDSDRLVQLAERYAQGGGRGISYPNFRDWLEQQEVFGGLAIFHSAQSKLKTEAGTEMVSVQHVSSDFFKVLGVRPRLGRDMRPDDDTPAAPRMAWITHDTWQRFFQGDPDVVGRSCACDGQVLTIAGVLPADFRFYRSAQLFTAIAPFCQSLFSRYAR